MFIKIDALNGLAINVDAIDSFHFDNRMYANGPGDITLVVRMSNGREHRIKHDPQYFGGTNVYEVERKILAAKEWKPDANVLQARLDLIAAIAEGSGTVNRLAAHRQDRARRAGRGGGIVMIDMSKRAYMVRHNPNCPSPFEVRTGGDAALVEARERRNFVKP